MRRCFIVIASLLFLISSCTSNKKKIPIGYSKLTVVLDSNAIFYLNNIIAEIGDFKIRLQKEYDTSRKDFTYSTGKIKNNEYNIRMFSLLGREQSFPLSLINDTIIFIDKARLLNFERSSNADYSISNLTGDDTLTFAYEQHNCWGRRFDLIKINKKANDFTVEVRNDFPDEDKVIAQFKINLGAVFSDSIKKLESSCIEIFKVQQKNLTEYSKKIKLAKTQTDSFRLDMLRYNYSNLSKTLHVLKGNKVYTFNLWGDRKNEDCYHSFFTFLKSSSLEL
jgi:hypothetical protein